ncbi:MAG: aldehyde ferredoxin oxidoreductase family protein [Promethearchaeota archaeon]
MILSNYSPSPVVNGYTNRLLFVDLTKKEVEIQDVPEEVRVEYQGGRGYAAKILFERTDARTDPLGPENPFIVATGPMTGEYRWPGGSKSVVVALSPATNGYGEASVGGGVGQKLKYAGFDAVCVTGKSDSPVVLVIDGPSGEVRLEDDPGDEDSLELGKKLLDQHGKDQTGVFCIGIGGRKLVKFACVNGIYHNGKYYIPRQAGRTGMGAVCGSKNLTAVVAVGVGPKHAPVADEAALADAGKRMRKVIAENDKHQLHLSRKGTSGLVEMMNETDILPVKNFSTSNTPDAEKLDSNHFIDDVFQKTLPCSPGCNLACGKYSIAKLPDGREVEVDGPEYETIGMLGSNLAIWDANWVAEANYLCDSLGIDTISAGNLIGFAMECYERGFLTKEDTGGIDLSWGNADAARTLINQIARREGFGDVVAGGIFKLVDFVSKGDDAVRSEVESFAVHSKGLGVSAYIPRSSIAQQVAYATSLIGAHHREAWLIFIDAVKNEIPTFDMKAETLFFFQNVRTWVDIAGFCKLQWIDVRNPESKGPKNLATLELYVKAINAVTGSDWGLEEHLRVSERVYTLVKLVNIRRGLGRADDRLPVRATGDIPAHEFDKLLDTYYGMRGWDESGVPKRETLEELNVPADGLFS